MDKEKLDKVKKAVDKVNKDFGDGTIITEPLDTEIISTGSFGLDNAIGVGGFPRGRVVEIYGPESSGKTTLAIHAIAEAQKNGGIAVVIDAEHSFSLEYAKALGVDTDKDRLLFCQPNSGEEALQVADDLINSGGVDIVVIDSVAALVPKGELEGDMGDSKMGLQARLMGQAMRKLVASISKNNVLCIFINQLREKIGVMFGSPETTSGGNALKFYASVRLDIRRIASNKDGEDFVSNRVKVKVVKNKVAPPFKKAEFDIIYGQGIDRLGEITDLGVEYEIIKKGGAWFSYGTGKAQGREGFKSFLRDNLATQQEIETKLKKIIYEKT